MSARQLSLQPADLERRACGQPDRLAPGARADGRPAAKRGADHDPLRRLSNRYPFAIAHPSHSFSPSFTDFA